MSMLAPIFLVFDSKTGPGNVERGWTYCPSKDTKVQWPNSVRRGRPRKDPNNLEQSLKHPMKDVQRRSNQRYEFVNSADGRRPTDPNTRKFVRTHVMNNHQLQKRAVRNMESESRAQDTEWVVELERPLLPSPERWSSDPFDSFPIQMQPYMHELLYLYVSAAAVPLYPIEAYWGFNPTKKVWIPLALTDPALLNAILFTVQQFKAAGRGQKEGLSAVNHLSQAIKILNERLQKAGQEISDSTIATVAGLALTEQSSGHQANWGLHMTGMKRMVEMRGGMLAFKENPILHDKLCRADICGSVHALSKPYLRIEYTTVQRDVLIDRNEIRKMLTVSPGFQALDDDHGFEPDLFDILCKLRTVTEEINSANQLKSDIIPLRVREKLREIQYYFLCSEKCDISGSATHLLRLGILLFVGILQNEFWASPVSKCFIRQLQFSIQSEHFSTSSVNSLRLWLLFLAGSVVFDPAEKSWAVSSIIDAVSQLSLFDWDGAKLVLESFAWVAKVQNDSGRKIWDEAIRL